MQNEILYDGWEMPSEIGDIPLKPFDSKWLTSDVLIEFCEAVSESTQTPSDMAGLYMLPVISSCTQPRFLVQGKKDWTEITSLYLAFIAGPAERKSAVANLVTAPLFEFERDFNEFVREDVIRYQETRKALENEIKMLESAKDASRNIDTIMSKQRALSELREVRSIRLSADDATPEQLATVMCDNGECMGLFSTEGGIFDLLSGMYSSGSANIDLYLKSHAGDPVRVDRRGRKEMMEKPRLSVGLCIQPTVLERLMSNQSFRGRGLCGRFLYSYPKTILGQRRWETEPIPTNVSLAYNAMISDLLDISYRQKFTEPIILTLSAEASELLRAFYYEIEAGLKDDLSDMGDWAGKLVGQVLRISANLYVADKRHDAIFDTEIEPIYIQNPIELGRYFLSHAKRVYSAIGTDPIVSDARYTIEKLKQMDTLTVKRADIHRACRRFSKIEDLEPVIEILIDYGYLREAEPDKPSGSGRPAKPSLLLNPLFFKKN